MWPFVEGTFDRDEFGAIVADAYATFDDPACRRRCGDLGDGLCLLELFHGPTLAFKDVALQLVGPPVRPRARRARRRGSPSSAPPRATPGSAAIDAVPRP